MRQSISVQEWHRLASEGDAPPAHITLSGYSMNPLIRGYRDFVTVVPVQSMPAKGDIVMICEPSERYVMHRVWDVRDGMIQTWGDNCSEPDGWFAQENIWGKVVLIERGRHRIVPDPEKGLKWARFWHKAGKSYRLVQRYKNGVLHRIKKLRVWVKK